VAPRRTHRRDRGNCVGLSMSVFAVLRPHLSNQSTRYLVAGDGSPEGREGETGQRGTDSAAAAIQSLPVLDAR